MSKKKNNSARLGRFMAPIKSSSAPFAPSHYAGLIFWGKPQDLSVGTLTTFPDNSGQANDASQTTAGNKPAIIATGIGAKNAIDFDGTDDFLRCNALAPVIDGDDTPWSTHFAFKADAVTTTQVIACAGNTTNAEHYMWFGYIGNSTWRFKKQILNASTINVDFGAADTNEHVVSVVHKGTTTDIWFDGLKVVDGAAQNVGAATFDVFGFGAFIRGTIANYFNGKLGEVAIYSRANTDAEVGAIHRYLASGWVSAVPTVVDLIMGTGQSNMEGRGLTGDASPSVAKGVAYRYASSALTAIAGDPVGGATNFSCVPAFVNQWKTSTGRSTVYIEQGTSGSALLLAADSGSGNWKKGAGTLYTTALNEMNAAITHILTKTVFTMSSKRILWAQGEREAQAINGTTITGPLYEADLEALVDNFDADVTGGINHFHIFELGAHNLGTGESDWVIIRTAQAGAEAAKDKASIVFTGCKNFPAQGKMESDLHYNKTGLNEMGTQGAIAAAAV